MNPHSFTDACYAEISTELGRRGFRKRAAGIFTCEVSDGVFGWLGLNRVRRTATELELYPIVGVVHQVVNMIICSPKASTRSAMSPTVSIPLCYLLGEQTYRTWTWAVDADTHSVTADLSRSVNEAGLAFIKRLSSPPTLYSEAISVATPIEPVRLTLNHQRVIPAAMYLRGQYDQIPMFLDVERKRNESVGGDPDFDLFAANLLKMVESKKNT